MIELLANYGDVILKGLAATVGLVLSGFVVGGLAGAGLAFALIGERRFVRWPVRAWVDVIRNTPFLIQVMLLFAALGVMRIRVDPVLVGAISVALYTSAYMAEIVRGALKSVPEGQWEAARALGLRPLRTFRSVIYPQLLPFALPASVNLLATVTKESAFLSAASVAELTYAGQVVIAQTFAVFEVWAIIAVLYLGIVLLVLALARRLEHDLAWSYSPPSTARLRTSNP